ncbi:MAG: glycosyltransferase family 4 protein [Elusimicrobia bacterium]|nr:glycosyltransferase family 4 protein [Elusimicrobiota bacterium]
MKILHITNAIGWSGGMEQISLLIQELHKRDHQNILVCPPASELIPKLKAIPIPLEPLSMFQDYDLPAAYRLYHLLKDNRPEIVHAHHPTAHAISLLALSLNLSPSFIVSRRVSFSLRANPFSKWKYRSNRIDRYSVVSKAVKETMIQGGVKPEKIEVIYSAFSQEKFINCAPNQKLKEELKIPNDCKIVGKIANFSLWKGQHVFLEAAKLCLKKNPKIFFLLAGKKTESLFSKTQELGISKSVRLLGFRKDIPEILSLLNLSVNSSIEGEGLSGALRESLALGIPVVASNLSGNREIVQDGITGFLAPVNDPEKLAEKILFCIANEIQAKECAKKGQEWVREHAACKVMVDHTLQLYQSALKQRMNI